MTKLPPEWVRTSDSVIRSPARYHWTTAPADVLQRTAWISGVQILRAFSHHDHDRTTVTLPRVCDVDPALGAPLRRRVTILTLDVLHEVCSALVDPRIILYWNLCNQEDICGCISFEGEYAWIWLNVKFGKWPTPAQLIWMYWMFYDHLSAHSLLANLGRWGWLMRMRWTWKKARRHLIHNKLHHNKTRGTVRANDLKNTGGAYNRVPPRPKEEVFTKFVEPKRMDSLLLPW